MQERTNSKSLIFILKTPFTFPQLTRASVLVLGTVKVFAFPSSPPLRERCVCVCVCVCVCACTGMHARAHLNGKLRGVTEGAGPDYHGNDGHTKFNTA